MKIKLLPVVAFVLLTSFSVAYAAPMDLLMTHRDNTDTSDVPQSITPFSYDDGSFSMPIFQGTDATTHSGNYKMLAVGSGIGVASNAFFVTPNTIETTDGHLIDTLGIINGSIASNVSATANAQSGVDAFFGNVFGTRTGLLVTASGNAAGFMTAAQSAKLAAVSTSTPSISYPTRSIVTGTGAVGTQLSTTQGTDVHYNGTIVTTATISGPAQGTMVLEVAPTNSATAGDWKEQGRCTNGQNITLAIALNSVQTIGCEISGYVPAGYYAKIRSITTSGSPTFTLNSSFEKTTL